MTQFYLEKSCATAQHCNSTTSSAQNDLMFKVLQGLSDEEQSGSSEYEDCSDDSMENLDSQDSVLKSNSLLNSVGTKKTKKALSRSPSVRNVRKGRGSKDKDKTN